MKNMINPSRFFFSVTMFALCSIAFPQSRPRTNPGRPCGIESKGLPDNYAEAVFQSFEPPEWRHSIVRLSVGRATKLSLWSDGDHFRLWTNTFAGGPKSVYDLLFKLDDECRLPPDPADFAEMIHVHWQSVDLSKEEFADVHRRFIAAVEKYISGAKPRYEEEMKTKGTSIYLDAIMYEVTYYNGDEDFKLVVPKNASEHQPMLAWLDSLRKLAEGRFHHTIWAEP